MASSSPDDQQLQGATSGEGQPDWSTLASRAVDDLARIIHTEIRLFTASLSPLFDAAADRVIAGVGMLFASLFGVICMLGALILVLHKAVDWWLSFAITGAIMFLIAGIVFSAGRAAARKQESRVTP